ncbi:MAG: hypothetical protein WEB52_14380 [Dehalococcoidia bacterium]
MTRERERQDGQRDAKNRRQHARGKVAVAERREDGSRADVVQRAVRHGEMLVGSAARELRGDQRVHTFIGVERADAEIPESEQGCERDDEDECDALNHGGAQPIAGHACCFDVSACHGAHPCESTGFERSIVRPYGKCSRRAP